ncbi:MAG: SWIM zinc finger domain-containing protein [Cyanophyceae cyanobacterium]
MPSLSEAIVHHHASPRSLERAEDLLQQGAVGQMIQRGDCLQAYVRGSQGDRYLCSFLFQGSRLQEVACSCPYSFEGWCKHLAAVGLAVARQTQPVQVSPSLDTLLESLDISQLRHLVKQWVLEDPERMSSLERLATVADGVTNSSQGLRVDAAPYRRQLRELIEEARREWDDGSEEDPLGEGILELAATVRRFLQAGEANNALVILGALSEVWAEENHRLDDYIESPIHILDPLWATAILLSQLDPTEPWKWDTTPVLLGRLFFL